jgi:hypothetical protein
MLRVMRGQPLGSPNEGTGARHAPPASALTPANHSELSGQQANHTRPVGLGQARSAQGTVHRCADLLTDPLLHPLIPHGLIQQLRLQLSPWV